jgi:hypothetical protein
LETGTWYLSDTFSNSDELILSIDWEYDYPDNRLSVTWVGLGPGKMVRADIIYVLFALDKDSRIDDPGIIVSDDYLDISEDEDLPEAYFLFDFRKNMWMKYPFETWNGGEGITSGVGDDENDASVTFEMSCNLIGRE